MGVGRFVPNFYIPSDGPGTEECRRASGSTSLLDEIADDPLRIAVGIGVGSVYGVNAEVPGSL